MGITYVVITSFVTSYVIDIKPPLLRLGTNGRHFADGILFLGSKFFHLLSNPTEYYTYGSNYQ